MQDCNHLAAMDLEFADHLMVGRRRFLKLATLGAGAALFFGAGPARASGTAEALLLSCMDFRLVDDLAKFMDSKGLTNEYDHIVLAGASAGASAEKFAAWHETFWTHLKVAIDLHKIKKVMIIDHRDCGAYKIAFGPEHAEDPELEYSVHAAVLRPMAAKIKEKHASVEVETYLMALDGSVEEVAARS
jgi:carbonic anhydrase